MFLCCHTCTDTIRRKREQQKRSVSLFSYAQYLITSIKQPQPPRIYEKFMIKCLDLFSLQYGISLNFDISGHTSAPNFWKFCRRMQKENCSKACLVKCSALVKQTDRKEGIMHDKGAETASGNEGVATEETEFGCKTDGEAPNQASSFIKPIVKPTLLACGGLADI